MGCFVSAALGLLLDTKVVQRSYDVWTSLLMSLDGLPIVHLEREVFHLRVSMRWVESYREERRSLYTVL